MPSPFENLSGQGKALKAEPPDANAFAGLKRSGLARLKDAVNDALSLESRFDLAYNAAHDCRTTELLVRPTASREPPSALE